MSQLASYEEALHAFRQFTALFQRREWVRFAKTGDGTGAATCDVDGKPGWIWVRYDEDQSKVSTVFCEIRGLPEDVPVIIGKPYPNADHVQVLGINWPLYYQGLTNVILDQYVLPKHGDSHGEKASDRAPIGLRNLEPARVRETDPAGLSVFVETFEFTYGSVVYRWDGAAEDLTASVPAGAGRRYALISLDPETNTLVVTDGAISPTPVAPDLPAIPIGHIPLAYVMLEQGQTTITEPDINDGRILWWSVGGVGDHTHSGPGDGGASLMCIEEIYLEDLPVVLDGTAFAAYGMYQTLYISGLYTDGVGMLTTIYPDEAYAGTCPQWIIIRPGPFGLYSTYEITVKHNAGNIWLSGGDDIVLDEQTDHLMLIYNGEYWCDLGGACCFADYLGLDDDGDPVVSKDSGRGIKVDLDSPTFGWRDLLGVIRTRGVGATDPNDATYRGNIKGYQFSVNDEAWIEYHIPHDYVAGTDIHLHFHWSHNSALVTGGTVTWGADITYAKGHNQAAFPAPVNPTVVSNASTTQYQHIITEVQISASAPSAVQIDSDDLEPDGVLLVRVYLSANDITSSGAVPDPFLHYADIHYQTSNVGTKQKAPDFYV